LRLSKTGMQMPSAAAEAGVAELVGPKEGALTTPVLVEEQSAIGTQSAAVTAIGYSAPTKRDFVDAIVEVITALPIYRTYVDSNHFTLSDADPGRRPVKEMSSRKVCRVFLQGIHEVRINLTQGNQNEPSQVDSGVRNGEFGSTNDPLSIVKDVDIDVAWSQRGSPNAS